MIDTFYLEKILNKIKTIRNLDFNNYRKDLLIRRINKRIIFLNLQDFINYYAYLELHTEEIDYLVDVIAINVTKFFRDPKVFDSIEKNIIPVLIKNKEEISSKIIRIWSCGCSSGEEAYSILILLVEVLGVKLKDYKISIYGTDIDSKVLANAREGVYDAKQIDKLFYLKNKLIDKFFYKIDDSRYWIREEWSPYVHFSYHDLIADVPFEQMDMILCRNVFIYYNRELQNQILERFYKSLRKKGFLVLGNVESIPNEFNEKFFEFDLSNRIYLKKN